MSALALQLGLQRPDDVLDSARGSSDAELLCITLAPATDTTAVLAARLEAVEQLLAEREQTIEDLRRRLDNEAEERRKLTARLVDHRENAITAVPVDPAPVSLWRWLFRSR